SAQIREILISESAWEEMTCLFAPSLADFIICSPAPETPLLGRNASARILQLTLLDAFFVSVAQLNIEQANLNMQKTGAIVNFFSPGALK
ncbi:hypothetical protein QP699_29585, partial [Klebsiella michiganensis]|nr:hypothetical protein [Klebsiella michiganensis]